MNEKLMDSYLDNIAEQVVDEDKVVTYKSLSRNLGIHVNTAKQLLHTYLTKEKSKNAFPISATYLVAGKVVDGSFNISIVNEADLKNAYSNFVEVTSEHVYSVQKGKTLKDLNILCGIKDTSTSESSNLVIKFSNPPVKSSEVKKKIETFEENNEKVLKQFFLPEKEVIKAEETVQKTEPPAEKEASSKSPKKPSPKRNQQKAKGNVKKPAGNIVNLFAKAAQKTSAKADAVEKSEKIPTEEETKENENTDVDEINEVESKKLRMELKERSESKERVKKKKKGNKRKRIQMMSDSEEEVEDSDEEEEEKTDSVKDDVFLPCSLNLEEEEEENNFVPKNKRKKRKVIDKTVMNEDGYLETKKEIVFETDSENETEETSTAVRQQKKSKPGTLNDKGKAVQGSTAKKQSSLLTFFKKS